LTYPQSRYSDQDPIIQTLHRLDALQPETRLIPDPFLLYTHP